MMKFRSRTIMGLSIFFVVSILCYGALLYYFLVQTRAFAFAEGEKQIENMLLIHKAIHSFVEKEQKTEIYRLKQEGRLYSDYFSPKLLSRTYIARGIEEHFSQEREKIGLPPLYFKLATENPRNKINAADALELDMLRRMRSGELTRYSELVQVDGHYSIYFAIPAGKTVTSCLQCHGDPLQAPKELLEQYGDASAFHESAGDIRALISIRVPLDDQIKAAHLIFFRLSTGTGLLLLLFFAVVLLFVTKIERHQLIIEKQNEELSRLATVDMLTGIYNRQGFAAIMRQKMASGKRHDFSLSLIMMDLDFFKRINDTYGHGIGDEVLTAVGKLLSEVPRASDIVGRWGGEEFVIACTHTEPDGAVKLAEKVLSRLAALDLPQGIKMTASFGVAPCHPQDSLKEFVCRADKALYRSKENGRNQVSLESLDG
jgi:diguanylate cyclase (GGDEF)-like protein